MVKRRGPVRLYPGEMRSVKGLAALQANVARLPDQLVARIQPALEAGAQDMVDLYQHIAPVDEKSAEPGALGRSARVVQGDHELSVKVVVDAVDEKGRPFAKHAEHGHMAADGSHVPAKPAFWPAYRLTKKKRQSRVSRAITAGFKDVNAKLGGES